MGKPYSKELDKLSEIYEWANKTPIDNLVEFVKRSEKTPLYVIGSGGSFSATTFASLLHQHIGMVAKCLTPLEFLEYENIDSDCSILIVTASGNNRDILTTFDKAVKIKPKNIGIVCASITNKLTKKAVNIPNVLIHGVKIPIGKDGFLATNSLIATLIWLCRSYISAYSLLYKIPTLDELVYLGKSKEKFEEDLERKLNDFVDRDTIVCLYDNWGKPAAADAESKLIEAGLVNVQLADYRNFAHGRHNWLDKNKEKTCLIALVNPNCEHLANKTMKLIPEYTPKIIISTNYEGPIATISLLIQIFYVVKFFGKIKNIDPGRPGVADFGRKIYHLPIPKNSSDSFTDFEKMALRNKFGHCNVNDIETKTRVEQLHKFLRNISKEKFGAIVFDYDGTLCDSEHRLTHPSKEIEEKLIQLLENEIVIGIATGRGKSVREALQKIIPEKYWSKVFVGYYNCSDIGELGYDSIPSKESTKDQNLLEILELLEKQKIISKNNKVTSRSKQITLENIDFNASELIQKIETIDSSKLKNIKVVESTHSVDLLSKDVSKINLIKYIEQKNLEQYKIMTIGDRGKQPGNDFELLANPYSLSVDMVSDNSESCWNLLTNNQKEEKGTLEYLKQFKISNGYFQMENNFI